MFLYIYRMAFHPLVVVRLRQPSRTSLTKDAQTYPNQVHFFPRFLEGGPTTRLGPNPCFGGPDPPTTSGPGPHLPVPHERHRPLRPVDPRSDTHGARGRSVGFDGSDGVTEKGDRRGQTCVVMHGEWGRWKVMHRPEEVCVPSSWIYTLDVSR